MGLPQSAASRPKTGRPSTRRSPPRLKAPAFVQFSDAKLHFVDGIYAIPHRRLFRRQGFGASRLSDRSRAPPSQPENTDEHGVQPPSSLKAGRRSAPPSAERDGTKDTLRASTVVVSAGAIHSPALLMRSGIGPGDGARIRRTSNVRHEQAEIGRRNWTTIRFRLSGGPSDPAGPRSPALRNYAIGGARLSSGQHDAPAGDLFVSFIARTSAYANGNRLGMVGPSLYAPHSRGSVRLDPSNPEGSSCSST